MAGRPLKPPEQRRNHATPSRGEWVTLEPITEPLLPEPDGRWSPNARRAWRAWRRDPVTTQWSPADIFAAKELCRLYDKLGSSEWRARTNDLGLSPRGRRDLRWRSPEEAKTHAEQAPVKRLRLMEREKDAEAS